MRCRLGPGADVDTPLHWACFAGAAGAVEALVEAGADVNQPGELRNTPLHLAAIGGSLEVAKMLLYHGADASRCNAYGNAPASLASSPACRDLLRNVVQGGLAAVRQLQADMDEAAAAKARHQQEQRLARQLDEV